MPDGTQRRRFDLNTEPHVAEVGDVEYQFIPEAYAPQLIEAWEALEHPGKETLEERAKETGKGLQRVISEDATNRIRGFLAALMVPESRAEFTATVEVEVNGEVVVDHNGAPVTRWKHEYPDRVIVEMQRWALEVYGQRPTSRSSGSSESSAAEEHSTPSTDDSSSEASTA